MFKSIGSVFSRLGKSAAFKGTLAAVGAAAAGEIGARLSNVAETRGYVPTPAAQGAPPPGVFSGGFGFPQQIPWGPILLIGGVGLLVFRFAGRK